MSAGKRTSGRKKERERIAAAVAAEMAPIRETVARAAAEVRALRHIKADRSRLRYCQFAVATTRDARADLRDELLARLVEAVEDDVRWLAGRPSRSAVTS